MPDRDAHKKALEVYLETGRFSIQWVVESLRDCSVKKFDKIVSESREKHGRYIRWTDISEIRRRLNASQLLRGIRK